MDSFIAMIAPMVGPYLKDLSPGRMTESLILLFIIWNRLKPHLKTLEDRLARLEKAVQYGFKSGESRFEKIESDNKEIKDRITILEQQQHNRS